MDGYWLKPWFGASILPVIDSSFSLRSAHTAIKFEHQNSGRPKFCNRSFKAVGPRLWNNLPPKLWSPQLSFHSFRQLLKTTLFKRDVY